MEKPIFKFIQICKRRYLSPNRDEYILVRTLEVKRDGNTFWFPTMRDQHPLEYIAKTIENVIGMEYMQDDYLMYGEIRVYTTDGYYDIGSRDITYHGSHNK